MDDDVKVAVLLMLMPVGVIILILAVMMGDPEVSSKFILLIIAGILAAVSAAMIAGKGAWLVAGYNTMSSDEKIRYDPRKVARGCGLMILGVAVFLAFFLEGGPWLVASIIVMIVLMIIGFIYINRNAKVCSS